MSTVGPPILTESVYLPFLLCVQVCLGLEVVSLWLGQYLAALSFRIMIALFVRLVYYFRANNEKYTSELNHLLIVIFLQDTFVLFLTQGLFVPYTWLFVHLPSLCIIGFIHYRARLTEYLSRLLPTRVHQVNTLSII